MGFRFFRQGRRVLRTDRKVRQCCCIDDEPPRPGDLVISNCARGPCAGNDALPAGELQLVVPAESICSDAGSYSGRPLRITDVIEYGGLCWQVTSVVRDGNADDAALTRISQREFSCVPVGFDGQGCGEALCTATKYIRLRPCPAFIDRYGPTDRAIYTCAQAILRMIAAGDCPVGLVPIADVYATPPSGACAAQTVCLTPDTTDSITDDDLSDTIRYVPPGQLSLGATANCCDCSAAFIVAPGCDNQCQYLTSDQLGSLVLAQDQACCGDCRTLSGSGTFTFTSQIDAKDPRPGTSDLVREVTEVSGSFTINADGTRTGTYRRFQQQRLANGNVVTIVDDAAVPVFAGQGSACPLLAAYFYALRFEGGNINLGVNLTVGSLDPISEAVFRGCTLYSERFQWEDNSGSTRISASWHTEARITYSEGQCGPVSCVTGIRLPLPPVLPPDADPLDLLDAMLGIGGPAGAIGGGG